MNRMPVVKKCKLNELKKSPWNRVLPEKLTGFHRVDKFPELYETREFIATIISARHLSLS
jgi:hypothetical protein